MEKIKAKIAVLVSGGGTNLQAIIDAIADGKITDGEVVLVISNNPKAYALERAKTAGIRSETITKKRCGGTQEGFEARISSLIDECDIDLIVLAGFMSILSADFTKKYEGRIINIHPSLIPSFCGEGFYGLKVHEAALSRGVKVTGATVHFVNEIPDGGKIIMQKAVRVYPNDTAEKLQMRVMKQAEWKILPAAVQQLSHEFAIKKGGK